MGKCLYYIVLWGSPWYIFLIDVESPIYCCGVTPGQVVLGSIKKSQVEKAMRSKAVGSTLPWPVYQLPTSGSFLTFCPNFLRVDSDVEL